MAQDMTRQAYLLVIDDLTRQRDAFEEKIRWLAERMPSTSEAVAKPLPVPDAPPVQTIAIKGQTAEFSGLKLWEAAEKLLLREQRAMRLSEMVTMLREGGLKLTSTNLDANLQGAMKRLPKKFLKVARGTWVHAHCAVLPQHILDGGDASHN